MKVPKLVDALDSLKKRETFDKVISKSHRENFDFFNPKSNQVELLFTHISIVCLTGSYAIKFKKAVNFGFLDFSTIEKRKFYCVKKKKKIFSFLMNLSLS